MAAPSGAFRQARRASAGGRSVSEARYIVVDWGTSNFRAFLVDAESGACLEERRADAGIKALSQSEFPHYLARQVAGWRESEATPIYLSGMVGAKRGWAEAPQLSLPVTLDELARHCLPAPGLDNAFIVPGVKWLEADGDGVVDVMRGEEVQLFGARALSSAEARWFCVPGTHSKWAELEGDTLVRFSTFMTGELYHAVRYHTLPGEPARDDAPFDDSAFDQGLARGGAEEGVLHALFEARSRHLYTGLAAEQVGSFLSGVLIGSEVATMRARLPHGATVCLIGSSQLTPLYERALTRADLRFESVASDDATRAGIKSLIASSARRD
nr:2-dehydro-3-deoxygalactonokinase [Larsenimonas salina]